MAYHIVKCKYNLGFYQIGEKETSTIHLPNLCPIAMRPGIPGGMNFCTLALLYKTTELCKENNHIPHWRQDERRLAFSPQTRQCIKDLCVFFTNISS